MGIIAGASFVCCWFMILIWFALCDIRDELSTMNEREK